MNIWRRFTQVSVGTVCVCAGIFGATGVPLVESMSPDSIIVDRIGSDGEVDWTNGLIRATGIGVPPSSASNKTHAREMAKRAARVVAYRNLLEVVQGIHVDSHTLVRNYMVEHDDINTKVQGIIRGARVVSEEEFPDGSFQVAIEMGLNNKLPASLIPPPDAAPKPLEFSSLSEPNALQVTPTEEMKSVSLPSRPSSPAIVSGTIEPSEDTSDELTYTGVVVNAKGLDFQRAMNPKLVMKDGREVYSAQWVERDVLDHNGVVAYVRGSAAARAHPRVTALPLEIRALKVDTQNRSHLVISDADAQTLHLEPSHLQFLKKAKVLVVLD